MHGGIGDFMFSPIAAAFFFSPNCREACMAPPSLLGATAATGQFWQEESIELNFEVRQPLERHHVQYHVAAGNTNRQHVVVATSEGEGKKKEDP
jgi:hypothetical protein